MKKIIIDESIESKKHEQLVNTAYNLFMRHGIKRVTVEEICEEAGISKMTFYKLYKNKIELAKYLLLKVFNDQLNEYRNVMKEKTSFAKKVEKIILMKHNSTEYLSEEFFKDIVKNPNEEIGKLVSDFQKKTIKEIVKDFKAAQKKGEIRKNIKLDFIIYFLNKMQELLHDKKLNSMYSTPNQLIMELTHFFFYGILTNKTAE